MTVTTAPAEIQPVAGGIRFPVASRPMRRYSGVQTVSNLAGATSFAPIQLPPTGFVRSINFLFTVNFTCASAGAVVTGDTPFNIISGITLTDAVGHAVVQPINGYNLYLLNKFLPSEAAEYPYSNPVMSPEYEYGATATSGKAVFRLRLELEQDRDTGYGCIPNLDANATLQLKVDVAPISTIFTGTTVSAANVEMRIEQDYWAPVGGATGGVPNQIVPSGFGDYLQTLVETTTVSAATENTVQITSRGGLTKGMILVSRAANVRTALPMDKVLGLVYDNNEIDAGIPLASHLDLVRRETGYYGAAPANYVQVANTPPSTPPGIDNGVVPIIFGLRGGERDTWLSTRVGTLLQVKVTPGAGATQLETVSQLMQVRDLAAFYDKL